jgi:SAM-dependent methyltransferase
VPDASFAVRRLAEIYDPVEGERDDLDHYLAMAAEFDARSVLDVGCGTGTFACLLADSGIEVVGVDPAAASLDIARAKPGAERVRWLHGSQTDPPPNSWPASLRACRWCLGSARRTWSASPRRGTCRMTPIGDPCPGRARRPHKLREPGLPADMITADD